MQARARTFTRWARQCWSSAGLPHPLTNAKYWGDKPQKPWLDFGLSWFELVTLSFSRAQLGTQLGYFEGILGISRRGLNLRKCLSDAALAVVPGGGIEPSTHGFSVRLMQSSICCKYLIYQLAPVSSTLGFVGFRWVLLGPRGQSDGQSERE